MKRKAMLFPLACLCLVTALPSCSDIKTASTEEAPIPTAADMVRRGDYLVNAVGCDDCHSPKRMGPKGPEVIPELRLSGYPADRPVVKPDTTNLRQGYALLGSDLTMAVGPWGVSYAANLTPDETGLKAWTEQQFLTAIRSGKSKGMENNRPLLPPMPWHVYRNFNDEDLKAMFAYLKSLPPVANRVPDPGPVSALK